MIDDAMEANVTKRLARIEGQVKGITRMVKERRYCIDIVMQVAAVETALHRVSEMVLQRHLETCVTDALKSGDDDERRQKLTELMTVYSKFRAR